MGHRGSIIYELKRPLLGVSLERVDTAGLSSCLTVKANNSCCKAASCESEVTGPRSLVTWVVA